MSDSDDAVFKFPSVQNKIARSAYSKEVCRRLAKKEGTASILAVLKRVGFPVARGTLNLFPGDICFSTLPPETVKQLKESDNDVLAAVPFGEGTQCVEDTSFYDSMRRIATSYSARIMQLQQSMTGSKVELEAGHQLQAFLQLYQNLRVQMLEMYTDAEWASSLRHWLRMLLP